MQNQLEKALSLAKKTGDRLIVFEGPKSDKAFVVMNLDQYEELLECDCGDDCMCSDHDDYENIDSSEFPIEDIDDEQDYREEVSRLTEEELLDKINRDIALWKESQEPSGNDEIEESLGAKIPENEDTVDQSNNRSRWAIKNEVKENADEIIEEDRHYLEEVSY